MKDIYCPVCGGCGEDGCCSAVNCQHHKDGLYCETYLKELQLGYLISEDVYELLYKQHQKELDDIYDKNYDKIHKQKNK